MTFLVGAVIAVLAGIWLVGEISLLAAVIAGGVIVVFGIIYLNGTSDIAGASFREDDERAAKDERALRTASEKGFRAAMIDALPEPAMYIDEQGRVETANAAARREFRFVAPEPLLSMVVRRPELLESVAAVRREDKARLFDLVMRDETDRHFTGVAAPIVTHDSRGVLVAMHDLTEIKRSEFARVDFLANASHELRTPLASLVGFIETLEGPAAKDAAAQKRFLGIMRDQARRMARLVEDLLSLSKIEMEEFAPPGATEDLEGLIQSVIDQLGPVAASRSARIVFSAADVLPPVAGGPDLLQQVFRNLLENAIKYGREGGRVEVDARLVDGDVRIAIADQGEGVPAEHIPRLTERFYRVDVARSRTMGGTGLGLAIVKHILNRCDGRLIVASTVGVGSIFTVVLPPADLKAD